MSEYEKEWSVVKDPDTGKLARKLNPVIIKNNLKAYLQDLRMLQIPAVIPEGEYSVDGIDRSGYFQWCRSSKIAILSATAGIYPEPFYVLSASEIIMIQFQNHPAHKSLASLAVDSNLIVLEFLTSFHEKHRSPKYQSYYVDLAAAVQRNKGTLWIISDLQPSVFMSSYETFFRGLRRLGMWHVFESDSCSRDIEGEQEAEDESI